MTRLFLLLATLALAIACGAFAWTRFEARTVVLTFDDGPQDPVADARILAVLRRHHARAIWFVNCKWLDKADNVATLRRIASEGHEIGNHGFDHARLWRLTPAQLQHEIGGCSDRIKAITGKAPIHFRPPWGKSTPAARGIMRAHGMQEMLWTADSMDHSVHFFRDKPAVYARFRHDNPAVDVAVTARSGDVILMHDYRDTAGTLDETLAQLEARGFRFR